MTQKMSAYSLLSFETSYISFTRINLHFLRNYVCNQSDCEYKFRNKFLLLWNCAQKFLILRKIAPIRWHLMTFGLTALNGIGMAAQSEDCLMVWRICHSASATSACHLLSFSEQSERMPFCCAKMAKSQKKYELNTKL